MNIYIHIPFCHQKCHYCYYYSFVPGRNKIADEYLFYLGKEFYLKSKKYKLKDVDSIETVYIGGGTPNYFSDEQFESFFLILKKYLKLEFVKEFVIELNPAACSASQLGILKKHGVTRLSFGIQTLNTEILSEINRHYHDNPAEIIQLAEKMGFIINLDFMLGLPGQKIKDAQDAVQFVKKIKPQSSFWCELRCGTRQITKFTNIPSHEETVKMYELIKRNLARVGYRQIIPEYFTSKKMMPLYLENWWTSGQSLGFGLSAFSKMENVFSKNTDNFEEYADFLKKGKLPVRYVYKLSKEDEALVCLMSELKKGFADLAEIKKEFNVDLAKKLKKEIEQLIFMGLIEFKDSRIVFTDKGYTISSPVSNLLLNNSQYLVKIMDTAFNFIDNMPNLEEFIRKHFFIINEGTDGKIVFTSPDKKSVGILEKYVKK